MHDVKLRFSLNMFNETELITIPTTRYKKINLNQRTQFSHTHTQTNLLKGLR